MTASAEDGRGTVTLRHDCEPAPSADASGRPASTGAGAHGGRRPRLIGIDAARGIALLGMMAVHTINPLDADGATSFAWFVADGKSAALFALLAGVGVGFASGGRRRPTARTWPGYAAALLVRALIIGSVGLLLGSVVPTDFAAVILPYYALLFVLAVPLLTLSIRALVLLAAVIAVGMPVLSQLLRPHIPVVAKVPNLTFGDLFDDPLRTAGELALTGVYPALPWLAYVCAGLAIGRALLTSRRTVSVVVLVGGGLVVASLLASWVLLHVFGGQTQLDAVAGRTLTADRYSAVMRFGWRGTTPTDSWWWLATMSPHSTTPLDLSFTIGLSMIVLGVCILLGRTTTRFLRPLTAAGSMTLTLYSAHLLLLSSPVVPGGPTGLLIQLGVLVSFALVWSRFHDRGPLEEIVAKATGAVRHTVQGRLGEGSRAG